MARRRGTSTDRPAPTAGDVYADIGIRDRQRQPPPAPRVKSPVPQGTGLETHAGQTAEAGGVDWGQLGGQNYANIGPDVARQYRYREPAAPKLGGPSTWHQRGKR
jgi:hypothetical protein